MAVIATVVWLLAGAAEHGWWLQWLCFATCCYLMVMLNNIHALIRIYSRMVSCVFMALMCTACFLFPSLPGAVMQLCTIAFLLMWFTIYQDRNASGRCYYAFLALGLASVPFVQILWLLPLLWILTLTNLMALSWRTWVASVLGVLTPYWFWLCWQLHQGDLTPLGNHLADLLPDITFALPDLLVPHLLSLVLAVVLIVMGTMHFLHKSFGDKIRIRMFYYSFMWLGLAGMLFTLLLPEKYDMSFRLMVVCAAPLAGHFIALTNTKVTNITFLVLTAVTLAVTLLNIGLWTS
jgi:hypothetical protein